MNAQATKLEIIERVLQLANDEALASILEILERVESSIAGEDDIPVMPSRNKEEITARLEQARADVAAGRTLTHEELVARTQQWRVA